MQMEQRTATLVRGRLPPPPTFADRRVAWVNMPALIKFSADASKHAAMSTWERRFGRGVFTARVLGAASLAIGLSVAGIAQLHASPFSTKLTVDPLASRLTVTARALGLSTSSSSDDTQPLSGEIEANFSFEQGATFSPAGVVGIVDSAIAPAGPLEILLGQPSGFSAAVDVSQLLAGLVPHDGTAVMTMQSDADADYTIDVSQFGLALQEGLVRFQLEGSLDETIDLSGFQPLVTATAPVGELATASFRELEANGFYRQFEVRLTAPLSFSTRVTFAGSVNVDLQFDGVLSASDTVYGSLAGIPGDFNDDLHVREDDLPEWELAFGAGADGLSGAELLAWQRHFGMAPPSSVATSAAAEPATAWLAALVAAAAVILRRPAGRLNPAAA